jgi:hypothetical protein
MLLDRRMHGVTLAIGLTSMRHRDWGLHPERMGHPCVLVHPPALAAYLRDLPLHPSVRTVQVTEALAERADETRAVLAAAAGQAPARALFAAREYFVYGLLNFILLYEGAVHAWLEAEGAGGICYRRHDGAFEPDLAGGFETDAAPWVERTSTHVGDLNLVLLRDDPRPKTLVFGDSHALFLFTAVDLIGARDVVLELVHPCGRPELKVSRHLGAVTMHGLASGAMVNAGFFREHGLVPGDRIVAVAGEIDIRSHVMRIARRDGVPADTVVRELCARFTATLESAVRAFGRLEVVVAGPAPPLEVERVDGNTVAVVGTIAERVRTTQVMRRELETQCARRGWSYLDVYENFADATGALDIERSDRFCHVSHLHKTPAVEALDALMAGAEDASPMPSAGRSAVR